MVLMFFLLLFILFGENGYLDLRRLQTEKARLSERNHQLEHENVLLYREIERLKHDLTYIENVARRELGMVKKEEVVVKIDESEDMPE
ncbi:MAG: septum formation initiator family protein [Desulfobacterales bacterium]